MEENIITEEQIDRLATLIEDYTLRYDGNYIYLGDGEGGNNPQIEQREKVVPKIKHLYDEFKPYMGNDNIKSLVSNYMLKDKFEWALRVLKQLWETQARFIWDDMQENSRREVLERQMIPSFKKKEAVGIYQCKTEQEKKYFAKAIEANLMEKTDRGCRWLHNNGLKASLGYFLNRVFNPKGTAQIPYQRMESLFNVSRLDTAIAQALTVKTPQKWRKEIDVLFDD